MKNFLKYCMSLTFALLFITSLTKIKANASTTTMYTIKTGNTQIYSDTSLNRKYCTVSDKTELVLLGIDDQYCKIKWSTGNSTKTGYVARDAVLLSKTLTMYTAANRVTTYKRPGGAEYGYISKGDKTAILGTRGTFVQVRYPVNRKNVNRNDYKVAFISLAASSRYISQTAKPYYVTAPSGLTMRKTASNSGAKVSFVPKSSEVLVHKVADGWAYCSYNGVNIGFLPSKDLTTKKPKATKLSFALYKNATAHISCGFDGYSSTTGKHEGIDIVYKTGKPVYALASGVVTSVKKGRPGRRNSSYLSTLAVYNKDDNKTVVYLHMSVGSFSVGDSIITGQKIGTQSWRGISRSSSAHTHVEVRNGRKTAAAISVGDYVLSNSNPAGYWKSKGYTIE